MFFLNPWMLVGLAGVAVPVLLHLMNRRKSARQPWGAMMFLAATLAERRRKIMFEDILLLAARCLIVSLAALALARPYASGGAVTAFAALFAAFAAAASLAAAVAVWRERRIRRRLVMAAAALAVFAAAITGTEGLRKYLRGTGRGAADVAVIIDASSSMSVKGEDGRTAFERALREADSFIHESPRQTAFAIILAASPAKVLSDTPVSDRRALFAKLDSAEPLEGIFNAPDAIAAAASVIAKGRNGNKRIVIFGDGQAAGWEFGSFGHWSRVKEILDRLPSRPRIVWRTLGLPERIRNLSVASVVLSRDAIGTDRETGIAVTVANTGDEAVSPSSLMLSAEGRLYTDTTLGQILPGESRTVEFSHRFTSPGTKVVKAVVDVADDLPSDNTLARVAAVRRESRILVVEGGRGKRLRDCPGAFVALALDPSAGTLEKVKGSSSEAAPGKRGFFTPTVVPAQDFPFIGSLSGYDAIILADVPRLAPADAARVAAFVERGGGLLAICGRRSAPSFLSSWSDSDGLPLMPLALLGEAPEKSEGIPIDAKSLAHPALAAISSDSDIAGAIFTSRWKTSIADGVSPAIGARLLDGSVLFAERPCGKGRVVQFAAALDPSSGNFSSRQSFLPAVQALAGHLVRPISPDLNLAPSHGASIVLDSSRDPGDYAEGQSLRAVFRTESRDGPLRRLEIPSSRNFEFNWHAGGIDPLLPPRETVFARWSGSVAVPASGKWRFRAEGGGSAAISFPHDHRYFGLRRSSITVDLEAGVRHDIVIDWECRNRENPAFRLRWSGPGVNGEQLVPSSALSPVFFHSPDIAETFPVVIEGRHGTVPATVKIDGASTSLRIPSRLAGGVYDAVVPAALAPRFAEFTSVSNTFARISFGVACDPAESRLSAPTPDDIAFVSRFADIVAASTPLEFRQAIEGAKVGRELWRFAAFPLFFLLVAEILLSNWITRERRIGEERKLDFQGNSGVTSRFARILAEMKGGGR